MSLLLYRRTHKSSFRSLSLRSRRRIGIRHRTITVSAVQDSEVEADHTGFIAHSFASDDPIYDQLRSDPITVSITDDETPLAAVSIRFTDDVGGPLTELQVGDPLRIYVDVQDLRTTGDGKGVSSAVVDLLYNTSLIDVTGITHLAPFDDVTTGSLDDVAGLVDEAGGGEMLARPVNRRSQGLFYLEAVATASGTLLIQTEAAEGLASPLTLEGTPTDLRAEVNYGGASINIGTFAKVVGHHLFYNNSTLDAPEQGLSDDDAIATDKTSLQPGRHRFVCQLQ